MKQCAHNVAPQTIAAIIHVESGGNQYALGVNGPIKNRCRPQSAQEAAFLARYYISKGFSVDLGLMQINSNNLRKLGYSIDEILDPRINITAGASILSKSYAGAAKRFGPGQVALRAALSAYNTGNYEQGFKNGYVAKYYGGNAISYGTKCASRMPLSASMLVSAKKPAPAARAEYINPYTADLTVYNRDESVQATTAGGISQPEPHEQSY
jgi:type IV secretion system protein VirB1